MRPFTHSLSLITLASLALVGIAGCDSAPDRFLLEDTQFVHVGEHKTLAVKIELYAPEGQTLTSADHFVIFWIQRKTKQNAIAQAGTTTARTVVSSREKHLREGQCDMVSLTDKHPPRVAHAHFGSGEDGGHRGDRAEAV